jgi:DNA invertase Pin-like site-specific DNA recombinase
MEHDLLIERRQSELARAKSEGKILGRPSKTSNSQCEDIIKLPGSGESALAVARQFKVSRANIIGIRDGVVAASQ